MSDWAGALACDAAPTHNNPPDHPKQQCLGIPFLPTGAAGEIVIHGPEVFRGYWKCPEATEAAFIELDGKRFFRTGDLGRVDEDAYRGESVKAVVVLRAEARGTTREEDVIAWCREHMAAYKVPRTVQFVDALPKSGSGKVMRRTLQEAEAGAAS